MLSEPVQPLYLDSRTLLFLAGENGKEKQGVLEELHRRIESGDPIVTSIHTLTVVARTFHDAGSTEALRPFLAKIERLCDHLLQADWSDLTRSLELSHDFSLPTDRALEVAICLNRSSLLFDSDREFEGIRGLFTLPVVW